MRGSSLVAAWVLAAALPALAQPNAPAAIDCGTLPARLERAEQARRAAQDDSDNAWKAVVPFAVLARKASAKAALDEADRKLTELKAQRAACEEGAGGGR